MIVITEYIYHNTLKEDIGKIVTNTKNEQVDKYGYNYGYKYRQRGNIHFFDKLENKTKNAWVQGRCIVYQVKRRETASKGRIEMLKINNFIINQEGSIEKQHIFKDEYTYDVEEIFYEYCFK